MSALIDTAVELEALARQLRREAATPPKIEAARTVAEIAADIKERFGQCHLTMSVFNYSDGRWSVEWKLFVDYVCYSGRTPEEALAAAIAASNLPKDIPNVPKLNAPAPLDPAFA